MLFNFEKKIAILLPFKTGSTSVVGHLTDKKRKSDLNWIPLYAPHFNESVEIHSNVKPPHMSDFTKFLLVRNPYARVLSMWNHTCRYEKIEIPFNKGFIQNIHRPVIGSVTQHFPFDYLIKMENMEDDLKKYDLIEADESIKIRNVGNTPDYEFSDEELIAIRYLYRSDFVNCGYSM